MSISNKSKIFFLKIIIDNTPNNGLIFKNNRIIGFLSTWFAFSHISLIIYVSYLWHCSIFLIVSCHKYICYLSKLPGTSMSLIHCICSLFSFPVNISLELCCHIPSGLTFLINAIYEFSINMTLNWNVFTTFITP